MALHYVSRYATSKARIERYLDRKVKERGWAGDHPPDVAVLVDKLAALGYVDDASFAEGRARSMAQSGYGGRRVAAALAVDRIADTDRAPADAVTAAARIEAILRFARRRRAGPFATVAITDPAARQRLFGAFVRAGHDFALTKAVLALAPGESTDALADDDYG